MKQERPVLDQLNIVSADMAATAAFYRRLGLEVDDKHPWSTQHCELEVPDSGLHVDLDSRAFAAQWCKGWPPGRSGVVLGFRVSTRAAVDHWYGELTAAGHRGLQPPYDAFWGARYAVVADPDGNAVGLMSPSDDAYRSEGPAPDSVG